MKRIMNQIMKLKPRSVSKSDFLKLIFNTTTRIISPYKAKHECEMPGIYYVNGCLPIAGTGKDHRKVKRYEMLWVRCDDTMPDIIDVDNKGHVYRMTQKEWAQFRLSLQLVPGYTEI